MPVAPRAISVFSRNSIAELRNFVVDLGSSSLSTVRCDKQADAGADTNSDQQSADFTEETWTFLPQKHIAGAARTVGGRPINVAQPVFDVVKIIRQAVAQ